MSGEMEAAGALATAGLAAGAIEGREAHKPGEGACLNCGAALSGAYCSACGQAAHPHRSLIHMVEEVLHGLFHFETKAWRTFPKLMFRPGTLTREYTYGKRARYISPLALFLFMIFLMFFVFSLVSPNVFNVNVNNETSAETRADLSDDLAEARADLQEAEASLAAHRAERAGAASTLAEQAGARGVEIARSVVTRLEERLAREEAAVQKPAAERPAPASGSAPAGVGDEAGAAIVDGEGRWQDELSAAVRAGKVRVNTGLPRLNERILHSLENPDLALYKVQNAAYKFSFLLVPISLPFMWLLFLWRRGLTFYDHAVFTLYSLSFASMAFVVMGLANNRPWLEWLGALVFFAMPVHMYFHLKGAYALSWWSALWRTSFLLIFAFLSIAMFVVAIIFLGLGG